MLYFILGLFIISFLIVISVLKKSENIDIKNRAIIEKEEAHIDEEMVAHQALEKAGALPSHHHKEQTIHNENIKRKSIYYTNLLYILGYIIIVTELWYIYKALFR